MCIEVEKLRLKFPESESPLFTGLDLKIGKGEKVLIVGPSGSGKSTLLNVLGGLIPDTITIPMKADRLELPESSAYVFQDPESQFTMPTIAEELAFVLENRQVPKEEMKPLFMEALDMVGLDVAPERAIQALSGGMKQKLAIASALLQQADTLFLDEPTSMLDGRSAANLWDTVRAMWDELTVVIIEHRVEALWHRVDRVILMDDAGRIACSTTPEKMLEEHRRLLDQYGVWHPCSWQDAPVLPKIEPQAGTLMEAKDLSIRRGGRHLLTIEDLRIGKGEWITLEGDNGTGKSSLLLALMKLIPSRGKVLFGGGRIGRTRHLDGRVYPVFQNPELQFITNRVFDEVFINLEMHHDDRTARRETNALLERFGLGHVAHLHPLEISTGQKRRLSVATAAGGVPEVIIFDEPTFGLDQRHAFGLLTMIHEMVKRGTSVIMITHDAEIMKRYPSRRLMIEGGRLVERGKDHA